MKVFDMKYEEWQSINALDVYWLENLRLAKAKLKSNLLDEFDKWDSLIVNKREPHTYRAFHVMKNGTRICLHRFTPCEAHNAFPHPHPWAGAFEVLDGNYLMHVGMSTDPSRDPHNVTTVQLSTGSVYAITNPLTWHSVQPLTECFSIMVNGKPFKEQHDKAPTTKGKDLDKMTPDDLQIHLDKFKCLLFGGGTIN